MKRILIRNNWKLDGGVENVTHNLVMYLAEQGYDVTVVGDQCRRVDFYQSYPKCVKYFKTILFPDRGARKTLRWFLTGVMNKANRVLYKCFLKTHFDVAIAMKEGHCMQELNAVNADKKFAWVHVDYNFLHWTSCCFRSDEEELQCMQKYDKVVCVSQAACDSVKNTIGDPGNLCVRYNPLDIKRIKMLSDCDGEMAKRDNRPILVSVGRLVQQKNYQLLLYVCAELQKKYQFEMWIIGEGPDRAELEKIIDGEDLKCVKLFGKKDNPYSYIKQADIYVSSAVWESYGLAIQEALILGVPVVAVKCPAIEETFDTQFGLLTNNSFEELYAAVEKMIVDEAFRQECKDHIREHYCVQDLYEKRLKEICDLWE